jgi:hypothetical protein
MLKNLIMASAVAATLTPVYAEDVFCSSPYTGTAASQSVTTGVDVAGGGLLWIKPRNAATSHLLFDTSRGTNSQLSTDSTAAASTTTSSSLASLSSTGFTVGTTLSVSGTNYSAYSFKKSRKFMDVVPFTLGTNTNRRLSHILGLAPGMIIVKIHNATGSWYVYHNGITSARSNPILLTAAAPTSVANFWGTSDPTASDFGINETALGSSGTNAIAYVFAHDTGADGLIQCGSVTTNASSNATVNLGWKPQLLMLRKATASDNWAMVDIYRRFSAYAGESERVICADIADSEASVHVAALDHLGFSLSSADGNSASTKYLYLAIRSPHKVPTTGTSVLGISTANMNSTQNVGIVADICLHCARGSSSPQGDKYFNARMLGNRNFLVNSSAAPSGNVIGWDMYTSFIETYGAPSTTVSYFLKEATGFMRAIKWKGTVSNITITHTLGAIPELAIINGLDVATSRHVYYKAGGSDGYMRWNAVAASLPISDIMSVAPTSTTFELDGGLETNYPNQQMIAYLFASLDGISKIGKYTGNGTSQTINCGFAAGARFIMIKRIDSTGDWFVWDSVRGIVAGNDPYFAMNTTTAEITNDDSVDPAASGFIVNQVGASNVNANGATYLYLAIA